MFCPAGKYLCTWRGRGIGDGLDLFVCFACFLANALCPIVSFHGKQSAEKETIMTKPVMEKLWIYSLYAESN